MRGLYVHIPFCVKKCSYCDFYSLPGRLDSLGPYVQAVMKESHKYAKMSFDTLYLGGGTPSLLGAKNLKLLIDGLGVESSSPLAGGDSCEGVRMNKFHSHPDLSHQGRGKLQNNFTEATIEMNPESTTPEFLETVKETGFNRVSIGVQSLSDDELRSVGRIHTAAQAISAVKRAQKAGFHAVSTDLIIGLPGQTWKILNKTLETLVGLGIHHLSVYCLSLEDGTPLAKNPPDNLPSDDTQVELYDKTRTFLIGRGFIHYEISNFALKGYECKHNLNYWHGGEYLGLGPSAASHLDGKRFRNNADLNTYLQNPIGQIEYIEELNAQNKAAEEAMLRLRLLEEGLDTHELTTKYGVENVQDVISRLDGMVCEGLLTCENSRYRLSPSRIMTSNPIFARVLLK